jgi:SNF2 family DNA or RNA helicase
MLKNYDSLKLLLSQSGNQELIDEEEKKKALNDLSKTLQPHILRRTKNEVNLQLPELEEVVVKLLLTDTQKYYHKNIVQRNYENLKLMDVKKNQSKMNLLNIMMALRLVANHHFLFLYKKSFTQPTKEKFREEIIESSNKVKFLERVLQKILDQGHKVLIFSQFTIMLDILGLFLNFKEWSYERLDG